MAGRKKKKTDVGTLMRGGRSRETEKKMEILKRERDIKREEEKRRGGSGNSGSCGSSARRGVTGEERG